ncbi:sialate O-acetylesterase [bacterium]|nr:sialate O-acetylesterase [bacterium]
MEMGMKLVLNATEEIRQANYPEIRLFDIGKAESDTVFSDVKGKWKVCTAETISEGDWEGFSAVAYFFGRRIHKELKVPVGLIDISWSATHIEPWIAPEGYHTVREVSELYDNRFQTAAGGVWGEPYRPARIYNAMVAPVSTFSIRGVLWYQGESNVGDGMQYYYKMNALITGWRQLWKQGDFPFYFVQIAPYRDYAEGELAKLWEAQRKTLEISNTGMAKTEDIGDWNEIHPKNKLDVGERLAKIALKQAYGIK